MRSIDIDVPFGLIIFVMLFLNGIVYLASMLFGVAPPLGEFFDSRLEVVLGGVLIGLLAGKWTEGSRWRSNAKQDHIRLFSRGRLYKVEYGDSLHHDIGKGTTYKEVKRQIKKGDWPEFLGKKPDTTMKLRATHWPAKEVVYGKKES